MQPLFNISFFGIAEFFSFG